MQIIELEAQRLRSLRALAFGTLRLKWLRDATRFEIAAHRHGLALKAGFNPNQPRVPKGNPDGGQWTDAGGGGSGGPDGDGRSRDGSKIPTNRNPKNPEDRPPKSKDRTKAKKAAARLLDQLGSTVEVAVAVAKLGSWLQTYSAEIDAYRDPPKSLEELQRAASTPAAGYDIHHIVEQTSARRGGFPNEVIDSPENLVRVPRLKHQEINAWYQTKNEDFGGLTPREYLSGRSWEVRKSVGMDALRMYGVLKP
jgi:hypothetical protein